MLAPRLGVELQFVNTAGEVSQPAPPSAASSDSSSWDRVRQALDEVGAQRDCYASHLYWYTDLNEVQAAARREGKPILSLRLLGKLTDEFSCANSRFFRGTLYANQTVSQVLRDQFILHWQSERPVPIVTIDFGDGRLLRRTVTGNSVHYVLDSNGRPIDALPGLYGPRAFLRGLGRAERIAREIAAIDDSTVIARRLREYHRQRLSDLHQAWQADVRQIGADEAAAHASASAKGNTANQRAAVRTVAAKSTTPPCPTRPVSVPSEKGPRNDGSWPPRSTCQMTRSARRRTIVSGPVSRRCTRQTSNSTKPPGISLLGNSHRPPSPPNKPSPSRSSRTHWCV